MAAEAITENLVTIYVNDVELRVPKGELIIESAKRIGIEIPIFCYHPRMAPVGMCRMCLVEVGTKQPDGTTRKMPKPQASCTLPASEGLVVFTDTPEIRTDRKGVLEFLLINHPLDCPICDRGGECPLQNNTQFYGPSTSRHVELKRHAPKAVHLSDFVTLDLERCIQCGRCVRFTEEISGDGQLAFRFRGASMQPSTFGMSGFSSKFSGNTIEICLVGALTSSQYRFRARPWDLESSAAICTLCSNGCNIWMDHRVGKLVRINGRTNDAINEEWTCDKGKFGHDFYNHTERTTNVLIRKGHRLESADWSEAYATIRTDFEQMGSQVAALFGPQCTNEAMFLGRKYLADVVQTPHFDYRLVEGQDEWQNDRPITKIEDIDRAKTILIFGTNLADELPIVYLRVRRARSRMGAKVIVANIDPSDADEFADIVLYYRPGTGSVLAKALVGEMGAQEASEETGVSVKLLELARTSLIGNEPTLITTKGLLKREGKEVVASVKRLATALKGSWNFYGLTASDQGASDLSIIPETNGFPTAKILQECVAGNIKSLWLVGFEPFDLVEDRELVKRALEAVDFLVVQVGIATESVNYASVVLPQSLPAETGGSFTNVDGTIQVQESILSKPGDTKSDWQIFAEVLRRAGIKKQIYSDYDIRRWMEEENPLFRPMEPKSDFVGV